VDFDLFEKEIQNFYGDPEKKRKAEARLIEMERKPEEGIHQYAQRTVSVWREAGLPSMEELMKAKRSSPSLERRSFRISNWAHRERRITRIHFKKLQRKTKHLSKSHHRIALATGKLTIIKKS